MPRWVTIPVEIAATHPKFGIKWLAALLRFMLVLTPSMWLLTSIGSLKEIIDVRGHLTSPDYLLLVPPVMFFLWSGWNANLLGKRDTRFFISFFTFLALGPVILVASNLLWLVNSGFQFKVDVVATHYLALCIAWSFWAMLLAAYVLLSKRINVTLRHRVRLTDPLNFKTGK